MFAPTGYIPLVDLFFEAFEHEPQVYKYLIQSTTDLERFDFGMTCDILTGWVMEFCRGKLCITSDGISAITISNIALESPRFPWSLIQRELSDENCASLNVNEKMIEYYQLVQPVSQNDKQQFFDRVITLFDEDSSKKTADGHDESKSSKIGWQDILSDESLRKLITRYSEKHGFAYPHLFIDYRSGAVSLKLYDHLVRHGLPEVSGLWAHEYDSAASVLRRFDGYTVCVPKAHYEKNWSKFWEEKAGKELRLLEDSLPQSELLDAGFVGGEQNADTKTKSTVADETTARKKLRQYIIDHEYPVMTKKAFKANIAADLGTNAWNRVWRETVKVHPYLSKRGPKS
ncbi:MULTISPECIES: hypothetical protein [Halocynthiibacter]|uniref:Uncharacterized protein n=1 Tax=Halocynthiibacter halioticoli TaxID=2986804 RepID=A0AAE3LQV8_9RHOB|nr:MULTISPECIES: hypothetical protein [Halocynthiibacter]MCV6824892.1 hypothetical protein [Halocynthiibacter halioticoli]MCW4057893.1 hypothetical protein [Halocynthiibacter sp. SDUM655004]